MSFDDSISVGELSLRNRITVEADDGSWVTGKVAELALLGDEMRDIRVTLELDNGTVLQFDRTPDCNVIIEWNDKEN